MDAVSPPPINHSRQRAAADGAAIVPSAGLRVQTERSGGGDIFSDRKELPCT